MKLTIGYLYPDLMNIYGDAGNIICLKKRCEWRDIEVEVREITIGDKLKKGDCDLYFFGGGQDQSQTEVAGDLKSKAKILKEEAERGVPILSICGGYQLLGEYYQPFEGEKLKGVGIFPAYTKASNDRMIGNIVVEVADSLWRVADSESKNSMSHPPSATCKLVGFENHSGKTYLLKSQKASSAYLKEGAKPLGKVIKGFGNNGQDQTEGCIYKNSIGCYMHGSLLPKNPKLADWLIQKALEIKHNNKIALEPLDDKLENLAQASAIKKFS